MGLNRTRKFDQFKFFITFFHRSPSSVKSTSFLDILEIKEMNRV